MNDYTKVGFSIKKIEDGVHECGKICSLRGDDCHIFKFFPKKLICNVAIGSRDTDWSIQESKTIKVYAKTDKIGLEFKCGYL